MKHMTLRRLAAAALVLSLVLLRRPAAYADSTAATSPGTCANDASAGSFSWSTATNAQTSNDSRAAGTATSGSPTNYLKCSNFGFSIPSGATIDGITVEIERRSSSTSNEAKDITVKIVKADGSFGTENKADTVTVYPTTEAYKTYGGSSDLWSETWSDADINDADFGVILQSQNVDAIGQPQVDHMRITITYTPSAGGAVDQSYGIIF